MSLMVHLTLTTVLMETVKVMTSSVGLKVPMILEVHLGSLLGRPQPIHNHLQPQHQDLQRWVAVRSLDHLAAQVAQVAGKEEGRRTPASSTCRPTCTQEQEARWTGSKVGTRQ
jgi:hypothetical protein